MRALLKPSTLRLVALVVLLIPVLAFTNCPHDKGPKTTTTSSSSAASFKGCFDFNSMVKKVDGRFNFDALGNGSFFQGAGPHSAGQNLSLEFLIDPTLMLLAGSATILTNQGDRVFMQLNGTTAPTDDVNVVTFSGKIKPYGGTGAMIGTKGGGTFNGAVNLETGEGFICFDGYIFRTITTVEEIACYIPMGPTTDSLVVFSLLFAGWMAFLLLRRKRGIQA